MTSDNPASGRPFGLERLRTPPDRILREYHVAASMDRLEFALRTLAFAQRGSNQAREALTAPSANGQGPDATSVRVTWAAAASLVDKAIADLERDSHDLIAALRLAFAI